MLLGKMNQYCENDYNTKCNLQIQCDPYQITSGNFHRTTDYTTKPQSSRQYGTGTKTQIQTNGTRQKAQK